MRQYECFELKLDGPEPDDSVRVDVQGSFEMNGKETKVRGFYAGVSTYIVRYLPMEAGVCRYRVTGVVEAQGGLSVSRQRKAGMAWCAQRTCISSMRTGRISIRLARQSMR